MLCNEIITTWDGGEQFVCEAARFTEHSHADGLELGYLRPLKSTEAVIIRGECNYLDDGTRPIDEPTE